MFDPNSLRLCDCLESTRLVNNSAHVEITMHSYSVGGAGRAGQCAASLLKRYPGIHAEKKEDGQCFFPGSSLVWGCSYPVPTLRTRIAILNAARLPSDATSSPHALPERSTARFFFGSQQNVWYTGRRERFKKIPMVTNAVPSGESSASAYHIG